MKATPPQVGYLKSNETTWIIAIEIKSNLRVEK